MERKEEAELKKADSEEFDDLLADILNDKVQNLKGRGNGFTTEVKAQNFVIVFGTQ